MADIKRGLIEVVSGRLSEIYRQDRDGQNSRRLVFCYVEDERGAEREGAKSLPMVGVIRRWNIRASRGQRIQRLSICGVFLGTWDDFC